MLLLPYENITYKSELSAEEAMVRLTSWVDKEAPFWPLPKKAYNGDITDNNFKIRRTIWYNGVSLPRIIGSVHSINGGSQIIIKMRLSYITMVILCAFALFMPVVCFISSPPGYKLENLRGTLVANCLVILVLYLFATIPFKVESYIARRDLKKIFEAEIVEEQ